MITRIYLSHGKAKAAVAAEKGAVLIHHAEGLQLRHSCQAVVFDKGPILAEQRTEILIGKYAPVNIAHKAQAAAHYHYHIHALHPAAGKAQASNIVACKAGKQLFHAALWANIHVFFWYAHSQRKMVYEHAAFTSSL